VTSLEVLAAVEVVAVYTEAADKDRDVVVATVVVAGTVRVVVDTVVVNSVVEIA